MSNLAYKVHVKLGPAEFEAEGPEDTVKEQLAHFYIAASQPQTPRIQLGANGNGNGNGTNGHTNGHSNGAEAAPVLAAEPDLELRTDVDPKIIGRLFKDDNGAVVLRALPRGDERNGEALLLILWGYYVLRNKLEVTGRDLVVSIRRSGINLPRVDETLNKKSVQGFITTGGAKKGKCYSLNNRGLEHTASLAKGIFA